MRWKEVNASFLVWKISSFRRNDLVNYERSTNFKTFLKFQQFSPVSVNSGLRGKHTFKYGDAHEKIHFLENTRFKTLEHLSKTFWNDLVSFPLDECEI